MKSPLPASSRVSYLTYLAVFSFALAGVSCSKGLQSVSGKVLHKGEPIKGAVVTLHPKGAENDIKAHRPSGVSDEQGRFSLSSGSEPGAAPGEYIVTVRWLQEPSAPTGKKIISTDGLPEATDLFKGRYADAKNSKLTRTIKPGVSEIEPINLD